MTHFADRLLDAIERKGAPICVGIDPVFSKLPEPLRETQTPLESIRAFCVEVMRAVAPHAPIVKFQSACFERYHAPGVQLLEDLMRVAGELQLLVILDAKRGDIGSSAQHYAAATLAQADATTINAWCGADGIAPFLAAAAAAGKGLFPWVRASNPSSDAFQGLKLEDGRTVSEALAQIVAEAGSAANAIGKRGYSLLGAVVGATKPDDAARLRDMMPRQIFLVPGFGAQGGTADDVRACFKSDGTGALVTASRSITYAFAGTDADDWRVPIAAAAADMARQIRAILD